MKNKTKEKSGGNIIKMIKTSLRCWWLLNRLFHFSKYHFGMVAPIDQFLNWMVGLDITNSNPSWYKGSTKCGKFHRWFTWKLYNSEAAKIAKILPDTQIRELRGLISECIDKKLVNRISGNSSIQLTYLGLEQYSISYLIFGHDYARKIWTGVIVAVVGWFIISQIKGIEPQVIQVKLEQPYTQNQ